MASIHEAGELRNLDGPLLAEIRFAGELCSLPGEKDGGAVVTVYYLVVVIVSAISTPSDAGITRNAIKR